MRSWETAGWAAINSRRYREKVATVFKYMFELQHIYLISCQIVNTTYTFGTVISYPQNTGDWLIACVSAWEQSQFYRCWCEIINITCNSTTPTRLINLSKLQIIIRITDIYLVGHIKKTGIRQLSTLVLYFRKTCGWFIWNIVYTVFTSKLRLDNGLQWSQWDITVLH